MNFADFVNVAADVLFLFILVAIALLGLCLAGIFYVSVKEWYANIKYEKELRDAELRKLGSGIREPKKFKY